MGHTRRSGEPQAHLAVRDRNPTRIRGPTGSPATRSGLPLREAGRDDELSAERADVGVERRNADVPPALELRDLRLGHGEPCCDLLLRQVAGAPERSERPAHMERLRSRPTVLDPRAQQRRRSHPGMGVDEVEDALRHRPRRVACDLLEERRPVGEIAAIEEVVERFQAEVGRGGGSGMSRWR